MILPVLWPNTSSSIGGAGDYLEAMKAYGGPASAITEELKLQMVPQLAPLSGGALPSIG